MHFSLILRGATTSELKDAKAKLLRGITKCGCLPPAVVEKDVVGKPVMGRKEPSLTVDDRSVVEAMFDMGATDRRFPSTADVILKKALGARPGSKRRFDRLKDGGYVESTNLGYHLTAKGLSLAKEIEKPKAKAKANSR